MMRSLLASSLLVAACSSSHTPAGASDASVNGNTSLPDGAVVVGGGDGAVSDAGVVADAPVDAFVDRGVEQDYDDLAVTLAGAIRSTQLQAMVDGVNAAYGGGQLPGFTVVQPGELYGVRGSVRYDYSFHCEDQQAHDNFTCGPESDHIHWLATIDGPVMIDALSFSEFKMTTHWAIHEIYLNKPQVEETNRMLLDASLATDGNRFQLTVDGTNFDHVRIAPQPTLPFAGGITYAITATRTRATANPQVRSYTAAATVSFAANGQATITLDGTHTYAVDMVTGGVVHM